MDVVYDPTCLEHYGVGHDKGGHSGRYPWGSGANRYQNPDGSLTNAGAKRYKKLTDKSSSYDNEMEKLSKKREKYRKRIPNHVLSDFSKARAERNIRKMLVTERKETIVKNKKISVETKLNELNPTEHEQKVTKAYLAASDYFNDRVVLQKNNGIPIADPIKFQLEMDNLYRTDPVFRKLYDDADILKRSLMKG